MTNGCTYRVTENYNSPFANLCKGDIVKDVTDKETGRWHLNVVETEDGSRHLVNPKILKLCQP
ncbi:MAG: hypothetical protein J7K26_03135 [Candidatus Aenigmarchaeota archaeon]|nr:hypothetical protein [Candidatus Aenigmarchaeota archaeon]